MSETSSPSFTFTKDDAYYFSRRIPFDLICHYTSPRIAFSLRTKSARVAEARARRRCTTIKTVIHHRFKEAHRTRFNLKKRERCQIKLESTYLSGGNSRLY